MGSNIFKVIFIYLSFWQLVDSNYYFWIDLQKNSTEIPAIYFDQNDITVPTTNIPTGPITQINVSDSHRLAFDGFQLIFTAVSVGNNYAAESVLCELTGKTCP